MGLGHGEALAHHSHRLVDRRQFALGKLHVDGRAGDLNYVSDIFWHI